MGNPVVHGSAHLTHDNARISAPSVRLAAHFMRPTVPIQVWAGASYVHSYTTCVAWLTRDWDERYGLTPHVVRFGWRGQVDDFAPRLGRLGDYIDGLVAAGGQVSLLGTSAGASAVLNAFFARRDDIRSVVSVCGRLRAGDGVYPSLDQSRNRHLFKPSVLGCDEGISRLTPADKAKILTIRPLFDELVPVTTMTIAGATNRRILAVEHMVGIYLALSVYARLIVDFLARV